MNLLDIIDDVMVHSGEFIVGSVERTLINKTRFWSIVKHSLETYQKFRPLTGLVEIDLESDGTYSWSLENAPDSIGRITIPTDVSTSINPYSTSSGSSVVWRYAKPTLITDTTGTLLINTVGMRGYEIVDDGEGGIADVIFSELEFDQRFTDLVTSRFLSALGRSRRAFTIEELPIAMDAAELVSEGTEIWDKVVLELQESAFWHVTL